LNHVKRITRETSVELSLELAPGDGVIETPCGFLNHMITLLAHHAGWQVRLAASGDLAVDAHHLTEDVGIALGQALLQELQSGPPRRRYGECMLPMDGTLVLAAVDLSGRGFLAWEGTFPSPRCGDFDTELVPEFWRAFARESRSTIHLRALAVDNSHHLAEAAFKGAGRALRGALCPGDTPPSTKGVWL